MQLINHLSNHNIIFVIELMVTMWLKKMIFEVHNKFTVPDMMGKWDWFPNLLVFYFKSQILSLDHHLKLTETAFVKWATV